MKSKNLLILTFAAALIGCSNQSLSPDVYSRSDAQKAFRVTFGEVVDVMPVPIEGEATNLGTTAGAAVGYGVGRDATDDGDWSRTAGAVGGVTGALIGRAVEKSWTGEDGLEIVVELDNGELIGVVQADDVQFVVGERVRVMMRYYGRNARVQKL